MNKLRLDTDSNLLVLTIDDGTEQAYRPKTGTALELYNHLHDLAATDPTSVTTELDQSAVMVDTPSPAIHIDPDSEVPEPELPGTPEPSPDDDDGEPPAVADPSAPPEGGDWEKVLDSFESAMRGPDDDDPSQGVAAAAAGDSPFGDWVPFANLNNLSTEDLPADVPGAAAGMRGRIARSARGRQ